MANPTVVGLLVSRLRPTETDRALAMIDAQTLPLELVLVVNVEADPATERVVRGWAAKRSAIHYLAVPENVGPAGAVAVGVPRLLRLRPDADYVALFEEDDPPPAPDALGLLVLHLERQRAEDRVGGAGFHGALLHWRRATLTRPQLSDGGTADVDYIAGGSCPVLRAEMLKDVGSYDSGLFFGFEELEFGLRARGAGWRLHLVEFAPADERREITRRVETGWVLGEWTWRRYYSLRNLLVILIRHGHPLVAGQVALLRGICKPLVWLPLHPRLAVQHLRGNGAAIRDAFAGRLGRSVVPD